MEMIIHPLCVPEPEGVPSIAKENVSNLTALKQKSQISLLNSGTSPSTRPRPDYSELPRVERRGTFVLLYLYRSTQNSCNRKDVLLLPTTML